MASDSGAVPALADIPVGGHGNGDTPRELRSYHPEKLSRRHVMCFQFYACGMRNKEIAQALDLTESRVSIILSHPQAPEYIRSFALRVSEKLEDPAERLRMLAHEAIDKVQGLLRQSLDEKVVQSTAFGILDRGGYGKIEKRLELGGKLTEEQTERLVGALRESHEVTKDITYVVEGESRE